MGKIVPITKDVPLRILAPIYVQIEYVPAVRAGWIEAFLPLGDATYRITATVNTRSIEAHAEDFCQAQATLEFLRQMGRPLRINLQVNEDPDLLGIDENELIKK